MRVKVSILMLLLLNGCVMTSTTLDPAVRNAIALCGAGINASISAALEAKLAENIKTGGSIKASVESEVRAAFFHGTDASNATAAAAYQNYLGCVQKIKP